jgi:hypothetical protein
MAAALERQLPLGALRALQAAVDELADCRPGRPERQRSEQQVGPADPPSRSLG